jgi:hypothetical protein
MLLEIGNVIYVGHIGFQVDLLSTKNGMGLGLNCKPNMDHMLCAKAPCEWALVTYLKVVYC